MPLQSTSYNKRFLDYFATLFRGNAVKEPITDIQTGFIHHPQGYPLRWKRVWFADKSKPEDERSNIGFMFQTEKYLKPGATVEIAIPLKDELEKFRGKVVMVRHRGDHFDIGLWLKHRSDATRARLLEQLCHIEAYFKEKKFRDGPYILNRERVAEEWIAKHASSVPNL